MINTHVHIINKVFPYGPKTSREPFEIAMQAQANLNEMLASGVTYTRVLATANSFDIGIQKMTLNGQWRGTGVVASGRAFSTIGGHASKIGEALTGRKNSVLVCVVASNKVPMPSSTWLLVVSPSISSNNLICHK